MVENRFKALLLRLEESRLAPLLQFLKFGLVGVSNTLISYGIEMLCYYVLLTSSTFPALVSLLNSVGIAADNESVKIIIITIFAFVVSVTNSYYWNSRYVFKSDGKRSVGQHLRAYFKTMACYALTGLVIAPVIKLWLVGMAVPYWAASLGSLIVTIPLNFVLNKFWAFRNNRRNVKDE